MTDQEINKAIAKWVNLPKTDKCDLCYGSGYEGSETDHYPCSKCKTIGRVKEYFIDLPNYTKDLNACHEALVNLRTWDEQKTYINELKWFVLSEDFILVEEALWKLMSATARQRCEALLRVLGKWKE